MVKPYKMKKQNSISIYVDEEQEQIIKEASEIAGLNKASLCRLASLEKAREILNKNKQDSNEE